MTVETLTVERLQRWVLSGAHWRVIDRSEEHAVVELCACTGEPVERLQSDDPTVVGYLRTARSDLDLDDEAPASCLAELAANEPQCGADHDGAPEGL